MFFFLFSIAPIMVLRQRRITLEHTRATAELDAAREIQQHLVPAVLPMVEGFALEAAYRPAAEVGGDFYLAMKRGDGGLLLMVGDVSGKGLKAAMRGALALGLLRAYAAENLGPGALLEHTNREMQRTGEEGFITCICATIGADGRVQVANAGHLSPYWNGVEIEFEGAFPLGVFSESSYPEHTFALQPGDKLTFLSDGIVEAQNASGELFGFERTCAISTQPALAIADAAQQFGQNDDISVLTLSVEPTPTRSWGCTRVN
jgi:phosphoserine phosphatase RsbU/P